MQKTIDLTENDLTLIEKKRISLDKISEQIKLFEKGTQFAQLDRACTPGDGIIQLTNLEVEENITFFDQEADNCKLMKFVPASGAASRMFKHLHAFKNGDESQLVVQFIENITSFSFYTTLKEKLASGNYRIEELIAQKDYETILSYLLSESGLDYGKKPKALIDFHNYGDTIRKAIEEHLVEGACYAKCKNNEVNLHFTVSEEHLDDVKNYLEQVVPTYQKRFEVRYNIHYSLQHSSTDTIAVDNYNDPFRKADGELLFRPGGHGALLANLNDLDADLIFIKNIDNVVKENYQQETYRYKKALAGYLLKLQKESHSYISELERGNTAIFDKAKSFAVEVLGIGIDENESLSGLAEKLNRPMRICGMVKNEGEPGGGPFWVKNGKYVSTQIVETAQIDTGNETQKDILSKATHFNPVDLICCTRNFRGERFELRDFRDMNTAFISNKSLEGKELKALELPGLWNGAMSDWITLFIEVPLITFNPVKTVNDLLKKNHQ